MDLLSPQNFRGYLFNCLYGIPSIIYLFKCYRKNKELNIQLNQLKKGISYSVSELTELVPFMKENEKQYVLIFGECVRLDQSNSLFTNFDPQKDEIDYSKAYDTFRYIMIEDDVSICESRLQNKQNKDFTEYFEQPVIAHKSIKSWQHERFMLEDVITKQNSIIIESTKDSIFLNDLNNLTHDLFQKKNLPFWKLWIGNIMSALQFPISLLLRMVPIKSFNLGVTRKVYTINFGQSMSILATISYDNQKATVSKLHYATSGGVTKIIALVRRNQKVLYWNIAFLSIFASSYIYSTYRYLSVTVQQHMAQRQNYQQILNQSSLNQMHRSVSEMIKNPNDQNQCVICTTNARSVIFSPCLHFIVCRECDKQLQQQICPICRIPLEQRIQVLVK